MLLQKTTASADTAPEAPSIPIKVTTYQIGQAGAVMLSDRTDIAPASRSQSRTVGGRSIE